MSNFVHDFKTSLKKGEAGELLILQKYPMLRKTDGRKNDFELPDGTTLELKTDSYDMNKTDNFFFERWSSWAEKKPGGPWQSTATYFAYYFTKNDSLHIFSTSELRDFLDGKKFHGINIRNKGWTTVGFKVPRSLVKHLELDANLIFI